MNAPISIATCSCQRLNVKCTGEPELVSLCHCLHCQRRTGSAFGVAAFFKEDQVLVEGKTSRYFKKAQNGYEFSFYFCPTCGSTVHWTTTRKPGYVIVAAGAFADKHFSAPTQSVNEDDKHPWVELSL